MRDDLYCEYFFSRNCMIYSVMNVNQREGIKGKWILANYMIITTSCVPSIIAIVHIALLLICCTVTLHIYTIIHKYKYFVHFKYVAFQIQFMSIE